MFGRCFAPLASVVVFAELASAGTYYELVQKIENPKGPIEGSGDEFGISLAQVGEKLVVGAYREDTGATNAGAAYLFSDEGTLLTTIYNPTPGPDDWFGFSEIRGVHGKIIIGASRDDTGGFRSGSVYLYDDEGTLLRTITNPTPAPDDEFGQRIAAVGDKILVSAWSDDTLDTNAGAAYLFDQQGNLLQEFLSPNPHEHGRFGRSLAGVGSDRLVIGAYRGDTSGEAGAAYLFDLNGNHLVTFANPDPADTDLFGGRLAVAQDTYVLMGAIEDATSGVAAGTVYVYDLSGNLVQVIMNPTPKRQDWFGRTIIGVGDDHFLIGAVFDDTADYNAGAAYLYDASGNLLQTILPPEPVSDGHFSLDLGTFNDLILIGSHFDGGAFTGPGAVYVYAPMAPLTGDYNSDSQVNQADLDLVLLHWGADGSLPPGLWTSNMPVGLIDHGELDQVLLNWGAARVDGTAADSVPEPRAGMLALLFALAACLTGLGQGYRRFACSGSGNKVRTVH